MSAEMWTILPHARERFDRRRKVELGTRLYFGDMLLVLLRDRRVDGDHDQIRMVWELRGTERIDHTELTAVDLHAYGRWVPVAVSQDGTVLFNIEAAQIAPAVTVAA